MTTPRDLLIVAMDMPSSRTVERGDLSLALAGAELIDLLAAEAAAVDAAGRVVPAYRRALPDPLLDRAGAALLRGPEPHEAVGEWLWRRGRGLSVAYLDALEAEGLLSRERHRHWLLFSSTQVVLVDSAARRRASHRWNADEPVLAALAAAIGVDDRQHPGEPSAEPPPEVADKAVAAVLDAVTEAVTELADERRRRARRLDDATADNVRRGY